MSESGPIRNLPDDTPCWCVDWQPPIHAPKCQTRRALAGVKGEVPDALMSPEVLAAKRMRTVALKAGFLAAYSQRGLITVAARAVGIDAVTARAWRREDETFAVAMEQAHEAAIESLEDEALTRAKEGVERPIYQGGQLVGTERVFSDALMTLMLKGNKPRKYRENISAELSGPDGKPIEHTDVLGNMKDHERLTLRKVLEEAIAAQVTAEAPTE